MIRFFKLSISFFCMTLISLYTSGQSPKTIPEVEGVLDCSGLHTGRSNGEVTETCKGPVVDDKLVEAGLGDALAIQVKGLKEWVTDDSKPDPWKLVPYMDGRPLTGIYPAVVDPEHNKLAFDLRLSPDSKGTWVALLSSHAQHKVNLSIGLENRNPFPSQAAFELRVFQWPWVISFLVFLVLALGGFVYLAAQSGILREPGPAPAAGMPKAFSLARFQMAIWFFVILASYVFILVITWDKNILSDSVLALMGISVGTYLGALVVDSSKRSDAQTQLPALEAELAKLQALVSPTSDDTARIKELQDKIAQLSSAVYPDQSHGLFLDILSDANGVSFHRFQMVVWTGVVMILFVKSVWTSLLLPELNGTLLGLMGISSGAYLGAKFPEQKK